MELVAAPTFCGERSSRNEFAGLDNLSLEYVRFEELQLTDIRPCSSRVLESMPD